MECGILFEHCNMVYLLFAIANVKIKPWEKTYSRHWALLAYFAATPAVRALGSYIDKIRLYKIFIGDLIFV